MTSPEDWANAVAHKGLPVPSRKTQIALRVDDDVLAWFKAQGAGYQTRMNAVLRAFRDAHRPDAEPTQERPVER
ncbi:BrnA antitoxin family protein [Halochromatium roseum]|uniref:BrnA antitoxin family protein n=1 Tax=Halochromatium roseum TaxID=391920 RepID=UPI001F5E1E15|nr:BrnA antitoxin family protein [Halochromatium roseum]